MTALIEELEAAFEGTAALDCAIYKARFHPLIPMEMMPEVPAYTTSFDAALTVLPKGFVYTLIHDFGNLNRVRLFDGNTFAEADGETMPLAICAAALKAAQGSRET